MVTTLHGSNSFMLGKTLKQLIDAFLNEYDELALERIDGEEATYERISEALASLPFLSDRKMVVLRAPGAQKKFAETVEQLIETIPETTDVIIVEPKLDKRLSYYKFLQKKTDFRDFPELDASGLARWLVDTAKTQGGVLSRADAYYLVERVGARQQLLSNELEKLLLHNPNIGRQTIDAMTENTPQSTIFQLLEAAFAGNTRRALNLYNEQRALKVEPQEILAMIAWQLRILAIIKTAGTRSADTIAKEAKLNPFVVRKSQGIAWKLSHQELKSLVSDLLSIDARSKKSPINLDDALQHYLLKLAQ